MTIPNIATTTAPVSTTTLSPIATIPVTAVTNYTNDANGNPWVTYSVGLSLNETYALNPSLDEIMCLLVQELKAIVLVDVGTNQLVNMASVDTLELQPTTTVAP